MKAADVYQWLMGRRDHGSCDGFDAHLIASTLSLAVAEGSRDGQSIVAGTGLCAGDLTELVAEVFPHAADLFAELAPREQVAISDVEACLREMLARHATFGSPFQVRLAAIVARRAQRPHHLWQDLGLRHRRELSWLMTRHFEPLAARNVKDMKWKKFLYRAVCQDEGLMICTAPSCSECGDLDTCFGEEGGECLLAAPGR